MPQQNILVINGGSSSIKFSLFEAADHLRRVLSGELERIGGPNIRLTVRDAAGHAAQDIPLDSGHQLSPADLLLNWLESQIDFNAVTAVGHRIVHGMQHSAPEVISPQLLDELRRIAPVDPDHLLLEIGLIEAFARRRPQLPQVACFDTSFHSTMARVARILPLPRRFQSQGIQRYGFHGLSYAYLMEELARVDGPASRGCVILAHLGNGASLAAVRNGQSIDTSMGFTPAGGLPMGTRPGDLDPGIAAYLISTGAMKPEEFNQVVHHESGLLGISETSGDMRDLLRLQASDARAAEAVEYFCYQTCKWIGAFAAALGGLETVVFAGGIGEHAAEVRARICKGLEFLGVELDPSRNAGNDAVISCDQSRVTIRVMHTDEEQMIARHVLASLS